MSYQINELERQLSEARTRIAGLEIERDGAYSLLREAADENAALRAELDNPRGPAECDNGQANTCRHDSASGMDASFGPGKVWRCDHCGLCWIEGYSPHDPRAAIVRGSDDE